MTDARTPEDWGDDYDGLNSTFEAFAERLEELLRNLFQDAGLDYVESSWSTLGTGAFVDRIYELRRAGTAVDDPLATFGDLAVVTVVTRSTAESEPICELLEREFEIDTESSLSFSATEDGNGDIAGGGFPGRVFYDHPRLVVALTADRASLPEWSRFEDFRAEIRVQTLLQRAWHDIDVNCLPYLRDTSYPASVRDVIVRTATLIAQADDELARIADATEDAEVGYAHAVELGDDVRLDLSSLYVYVRDSDTVAGLVAAAEVAGMRHDDSPLFIAEANLWLVQRCGYESIRELDAFLRGAESRAPDILRRLRELAEAEDGYLPWATADCIVDWPLLVLSRADADLVALTRYRTPIENAINTLIGNRVER